MAVTDAIVKVKTVHLQYENGEILSLEDTLKTEPVQVLALPADIPVARIKYSKGHTVNVGNYQSVRFDVGIELPAPVEGLTNAYQAAIGVVDKLCTIEFQKIEEEFKMSAKRNPDKYDL